MTFIKALGYLGLGVSDLGEWEHFLINTIGVMASQSLTDQLDLRVDDYAWRIRLIRDPADDILFAGWEVSNADDLLALKERLLANEIVVHNGDDELKADRRVKELIWFEDPDGLRTEVFYGPLQLTQHPFVSPHGTTYNTGEQG
ncbi:MAG: biphenyl-2,3-diol 1,2-dioxygenase, partial [Pseudomonadota bacterium]